MYLNQILEFVGTMDEELKLIFRSCQQIIWVRWNNFISIKIYWQ